VGQDTGEPIHNAIVWQDTRTDKLVDEYSRDGGQAASRSRSACRWRRTSRARRSAGSSTTSTAPPSGRSGDLLFGNMDTWLIWNITGGTDAVHITDVTNASRTCAWTSRTLDWERRS
jgi:glycerol kinase